MFLTVLSLSSKCHWTQSYESSKPRCLAVMSLDNQQQISFLAWQVVGICVLRVVCEPRAGLKSVLGRIVDNWIWVLRAGVEGGLSRWKVVWAGGKAGESGQDGVVPANLLQGCQRRLWKAVLLGAGFLFMGDGLEGVVVKIQDQCRGTLKGWEVQGKWKEWQL